MPKETILILDKEHYTQWTLKTFLETEDYSVVVESNIEKALKTFQEFSPSGIITEYQIDQYYTLETIRELKKVSPEVYVMMVTDQELSENEYEEILKVGVDDYFLKPFSMKKIFLHLEKGLKHRNRLIEKNQNHLQMTMSALTVQKKVF